MEIFDNEGNLKFILEEIKKTDTFYNLFKKEFSELIYTNIHKFYPEILPGEEIDELLEAYAVAILNATESVIDKDRNYPIYRLEEELSTMGNKGGIVGRGSLGQVVVQIAVADMAEGNYPHLRESHRQGCASPCQELGECARQAWRALPNWGFPP